VTLSPASVREEQSEPIPDSNAQDPVTVRLASEPPVATVAKKSSAVQASVPAPIEARESDPGLLEIESLSQGTLEPVIVDGTAEKSSATDSELGSPATQHVSSQFGSVPATGSAVAQGTDVAPSVAAPQRSVADANKVGRSPRKQPAASTQTSHKEVVARPVSAATNRRNVIFLGLGGLCVLAIFVFVLRSRTPSSNGTTTNVESSPRPSAVPAPAQPLEHQVELGRDEASPPAPDSNRNSEQASPNRPSAAPSVAAPSEPVGEDTVRVAINIRPEGTRVFYRGKEVGRTPFTLELLRGERRVFEVGYPGYSTRRLVIDGAEKEISFNMTQDTK
jgi:hypothetical protein